MNVTILPGTLKGAVTPPSSKSQTHRAVLALMLAQGEGKLSNLAVSQDIQATQDCVAALKSGQPAQADGLPLLDVYKRQVIFFAAPLRKLRCGAAVSILAWKQGVT